MTIYTSYFAQIRNFPPNMIGLSTAHWNPKWLRPNRSQNGIIWLDIPPLKPGASCDGLCEGKCSPKHPQNCQFLKNYRVQLDKLDFQKILFKIEHLAQIVKEDEGFEDVDVAILVYEKFNNPCSERVVIQNWFRANGYDIQEWHK